MADFFIRELLFADDSELVAHSVNNIQFTIDDFPWAHYPSTFSLKVRQWMHQTNQPHAVTFLHLEKSSQAYGMLVSFCIISIETHCENAATLHKS